jgi:UDP-N-acetylmuramyl pentapeptide phosphotransferase/UDP-N-acetylglucosamine-1-phosphate transferase
MTGKLITLFTIIPFCTFVFIKMHIKYAKYLKLVDNSNSFNVTNFSTPTSGGLSFLFSYLLFLLFLYNFDQLNIDFPNRFFQINLCIFGIVLLSFLDDMKNIHPGIRFPIQFLMVALSLPMITIPEIIIPYKLLSIMLIIYWLYVVNIINFIDGLDGFLSTYSLFFFLSTLIYGTVIAESLFLKLLSIFFITTLSIFLLFNKPKAKIFMGDTGSIFLGYFIGFVSIQMFANGRYDLFITIMAYPLMDCSITIIKKVLKKKYPWERLFDYYFLKPVIIYKKPHSYVLLPFALYNIANIFLFTLQAVYDFYFLCIISILITFILISYYDKNLEKIK